MGGIVKYLLFLTGVGVVVLNHPYVRKTKWMTGSLGEKCAKSLPFAT